MLKQALKDLVVLGIAVAITNGLNSFVLKQINHAVLLVDGEMAPNDLQRRLTLLKELNSSTNNLQILSDGLRDDGIPDLATVDGQKWLESCMDGIDLIILDNLSTLFRSGHENEADSYQGIQIG